MFALILAALFAMPTQSSDAVIGVSAIHLESGRTLSVRGDERFRMWSVYKIPIALTALRLVDAGKLDLDRMITIQPKDFAPGWSPLRDQANGKPITLPVRELLRQTVSISDNTASDAILRLAGGPKSVMRRMKELGFTGFRVDRDEKTMAAHLNAPNGRVAYLGDVRDTATPDGIRALLVGIWMGRDGLSKVSHDQLLQWMIDSPTGPRRIRALLPAGSVVAHKTGTGLGTLNDAAIVTSPDGKDHVVIVVLTKLSTSPEEAREDDVAAVAKRAYETLLNER
jgi:beta-lactamase class A